MITDPVRNRYLVGLGLGIIIGAVTASNGDKFPTVLVILGAVFGIIGVALSFFERDNNGKKSE